jgi:hypothetical protein
VQDPFKAGDNLRQLYTYYPLIKPLIPRILQLWVRRRVVLRKRRKHFHDWPILEEAGRLPEWWPGWPQQKKFALVLTHDVDTARGHDRCRHLLMLEKRMGFKSSFNFVPLRYRVSDDLRQYIIDNGFEVGVHGLLHDGKLYHSQKIFERRSEKINHYLRAWDAVGFRSPAMHHNLDWIHKLNIQYDASTFDTDPFEPQSDGVGTIFPFWVKGKDCHKGYVELPYTLPQDFTLFVLMKQKGVDIWQKKLDWIVKNNGMALINTHPDYMHFGSAKPGSEQYPAGCYQRFLEYVQQRYKGAYWPALPKEVAEFLKKELKIHELDHAAEARHTRDRFYKGYFEIKPGLKDIWI